MKTLDQKGLGHHLLLLSIAVVVISGIGFAAWRVLTNNDLNSATASGWTTVSTSSVPSGRVSDEPVMVLNATTQKGSTYRYCVEARALSGESATITFGPNDFSASARVGMEFSTVCSKSMTQFGDYPASVELSISTAPNTNVEVKEVVFQRYTTL